MNNAPYHPSFKSLSRRAQLTVLGAIAFICVVMGAAMFFYGYANPKPEVAAPEKPVASFEPTSEQWAGLKIQPVTQTTFHAELGTDGRIAIDDDTTTPVFSPYSGRVTALTAKAGDVVKQNDSLFTIEATEFIQGQNDLITAASALNTAKAQLALATTTEKRQHGLYDATGGALKNWQQSQVDLASAQASFRSSEIAYEAARNHLRVLGKGDQDIDALANASDQQKMDAAAVVAAPRDGTVIQRQIGLGQYIQAGASSPVYTIGDLSTVWLVANVRETDVPLMHVGAPVEVHVLAFPDRIFKAKLSYVAAAVDVTTHRLPVRAEVENPDGSLKPEMFANFNIITGDDTQVLAVPENAVVYEGSTAHVWTAQNDKTIAIRNIQAGRISDGMVEVLSGLNADDKVITSGALFIDRAAAGD